MAPIQVRSARPDGAIHDANLRDEIVFQFPSAFQHRHQSDGGTLTIGKPKSRFHCRRSQSAER